MSAIAFPLRLNNGLLRKTDERDAFLTVIGIMARTPRGSWPGHSLFGFRDFFSGPAIRRQLPDPTIEEINNVLNDLGLTAYRVESIRQEPTSPGRPESFVLNLRPAAENRSLEFTI